jgi:hypothetical protein
LRAHRNALAPAFAAVDGFVKARFCSSKGCMFGKRSPDFVSLNPDYARSTRVVSNQNDVPAATPGIMVASGYLIGISRPPSGAANNLRTRAPSAASMQTK